MGSPSRFTPWFRRRACLDGAEYLYSLLYGRVGGEEALGTLLELLDGVDDVEVGRRAVGDLEDLVVATDLLQGVCETLGVASKPDGRRISQELALAAYGELQESGEKRREDGEDDGN